MGLISTFLTQVQPNIYTQYTVRLNQNSSSSPTRGGAIYCIIKGMVESDWTGS